MIKIKELKKSRNELSEKIRSSRLELKKSLEELKLSNTGNVNVLSDKFQRLNHELNQFIADRDKISDEIAARNKPVKSDNRKVRKIHNVAGRSVDPTGFSGVVSGGAPGSGKRK